MLLNASNANGVLQFPAPTGAYKVWVKDKGLWPQYKTVRLHVSMDNPKHQGDKFFALCEWASVRFNKAIVIVSDSLHRHNLAEPHAYKNALDKGQQWLADNQDALGLLKNRSVISWDYWREQRDFPHILETLKTLYDASHDVRQAFLTKARAFEARRQAVSLDASSNYLLEEVAAFAIMFHQIEALDVYPGEWFQDIFDLLACMDDVEAFRPFKQVHCIRVDFVKNKKPALPQAA